MMVMSIEIAREEIEAVCQHYLEASNYDPVGYVPNQELRSRVVSALSEMEVTPIPGSVDVGCLLADVFYRGQPLVHRAFAATLTAFVVCADDGGPAQCVAGAGFPLGNAVDGRGAVRTRK